VVLNAVCTLELYRDIFKIPILSFFLLHLLGQMNEIRYLAVGLGQPYFFFFRARQEVLVRSQVWEPLTENNADQYQVLLVSQSNVASGSWSLWNKLNELLKISELLKLKERIGPKLMAVEDKPTHQILWSIVFYLMKVSLIPLTKLESL
jgi:hypothetical protein